MNGNLRENAVNIDNMYHDNNRKFKAIMRHFEFDRKNIADLMEVPRSFTSNWMRNKYSFRGGRDGEAQGREHRYRVMNDRHYKNFENILVSVLNISKERQKKIIEECVFEDFD